MKPSDVYKTGLNCGESIIKVYNEETGIEKLPMSVGSGMGQGLGSLSLCGAVMAAGVLIGLETGRNSAEEENPAKIHAKELVAAIREKFGSEMCGELKANKVPCTEIMDFSYQTMKEILEAIRK